MEKQPRRMLVARLAPDDYQAIRELAEREGRSLGEVLGRLVRENELMTRVLESQAEGK